jgi:hypothetical protein
MPLGAINMQTEFLGKAIDVARRLNVFHEVTACSFKDTLQPSGVVVQPLPEPLSATVMAFQRLLAMFFSTVMGVLSRNTWKSEAIWGTLLGLAL